jgi:cytoskeletal protein CcmA (bactofilin family)
MSTIPTRSPEPEVTRGSSAAMGKSVIIKGQIFSREDLYVDGEIEGVVECLEHRLTVGPNARMQTSIKAREIVILGTVHGNIEAGDRVDIKKNAKLVGDIKTTRITIEDGAYFKGSIDITRAEPKPVVQQTVSQPASAKAPVVTTPVGAGGAGSGDSKP